MNADEIRKLLGILAGGLAGRKAGKGEPLGGFTGGLAGAVGGLFSATLVNSIEQLSRSATGAEGTKADAELREHLAQFRGMIAGLILGSGTVVGVIEGLGLTEQQIFEELGVKDKAQADALLVTRRAEIQEETYRSISNLYNSVEKQLGMLWEAFDLGKDKEMHLNWISDAMERAIDKRA